MAPASAFQFQIFAEGATGTRVQATTDVLNSNRWSIWAGIRGFGDGGSANSALLAVNTSKITQSQFIVSHKTGDIFLFENNLGLRRVNAVTGVIDLVLPIVTNKGYTLYSETRVAQDADGYVYLYAYKATDNSVHLVRFDPSNASIELNSYIGGGTSYDGNLAASSLKIIQTSPLVFDSNNNLYLLSGPSHNASSTPYRLYKVTRSLGVADQAIHLTGTSTYGEHVDNADALGQAIKVPSPSISSIATNNDGSILYVHPYNGKSFKIVASKIYSTTISTSTSFSLYFNSKDTSGKQFYFATNDSTTGIYRFSGTTSNLGELPEQLYGGSVANDCTEDGKAVGSACFFSVLGIQTDVGGRIYILDGSLINSPAANRIRSISDGKVWTVAGSAGVAGVDQDKKLALFPRVDQITGSAGGDIYLSSNLTLRIFKVSNGSQNLTSFMGNGNLRSAPIANSSYVGQGLGTSYSGGDIAMISYDDVNDMLFFRTKSFLNYIDGSSLVQTFGDTGTNGTWNLIADGTLFSAKSNQTPMYVNMGANNLVFNSAGDIFASGGYSYTGAPGPKIVKILRADGKLYTLAGDLPQKSRHRVKYGITNA